MLSPNHIYKVTMKDFLPNKKIQKNKKKQKENPGKTNFDP